MAAGTLDRDRGKAMKNDSHVHVPTWMEYPCSDGKPMSDNTWQFDWITKLKWGIEYRFRDDPNVFVAGDMLWYPTEGDKKTRMAPDVMVAIGRPKHPRDSYLQWLEGGQPPQVAIEVLSPKNTPKAMEKKRDWYQERGAQEYLVFDIYPPNHSVEVWLRENDELVRVEFSGSWTSPLMGIRIEVGQDDVRVYHPDGELFRLPTEDRARIDELEDELEEVQDATSRQLEEMKERQQEAVRQRVAAEESQQEAMRQREEAEARRQEAIRQRIAAEERNAKLLQRLREAGIDPDAA